MKDRLYKILEQAEEGDRLSRKVDVFIIALILLNVIAVVFATLQSMSAYALHFRVFEVISVIFFTIEYISRVWVCTLDEKYRTPIMGRIRYMFTPMALVDFLAIFPFYAPMLIAVDTRFLRVLRLFRIFRLLKLGRYSESMKILGTVLRRKKEELAIMIFAIIIMLVLSSSLLYYVEKEAQPEVFSSIPASMWWGIATLTTVGYGDVYPVTAFGKLLAAVLALLGIGIFALPAGVLASGFTEVFQRKNEKENKCPHCGRGINEE